jgi:hypothetical protein
MTTVLTEHGVAEVEAVITDATVWVAAADLDRLLGWHLRPEGMCRGDVCIPVRDREAIENKNGADLVALAGLTGAPVVVAADENVVAIGVARDRRSEALVGRQASDFELPDLDGTPHRLSQYDGRRRLLVAFATW